MTFALSCFLIQAHKLVSVARQISNLSIRMSFSMSTPILLPTAARSGKIALTNDSPSPRGSHANLSLLFNQINPWISCTRTHELTNWQGISSFAMRISRTAFKLPGVYLLVHGKPCLRAWLGLDDYTWTGMTGAGPYARSCPIRSVQCDYGCDYGFFI